MPLNYDLYNEQIPEMSSDREASSFHTKRFTKVRGRSLDGDDEDSFDSEHQDIIGSIRTKDNVYAPNKGSYVYDQNIIKYGSQIRNSDISSSQDFSIRKTLEIRESKHSEKYSRGPGNASIVNGSDSDNSPQ